MWSGCRGRQGWDCGLQALQRTACVWQLNLPTGSQKPVGPNIHVLVTCLYTGTTAEHDKPEREAQGCPVGGCMGGPGTPIPGDLRKADTPPSGLRGHGWWGPPEYSLARLPRLACSETRPAILSLVNSVQYRGGLGQDAVSARTETLALNDGVLCSRCQSKLSKTDGHPDTWVLQPGVNIAHGPQLSLKSRQPHAPSLLKRTRHLKKCLHSAMWES